MEKNNKTTDWCQEYTSEICTKAVLTFEKLAQDNLFHNRYAKSHTRTLNSVLEYFMEFPC